MSDPTYDIASIDEPVFVTEEDACEYRDENGIEDFDGEGWYIQTEIRIDGGSYGEYRTGSVAPKYFGPYGTEQEALEAIPSIAPGIFVRLK